ncbi:hypothetical protein [Paenibacillus popilliae]|uniref:Dehydrogenase n=1 Tax=Paenibacillus popilliae ATCC 14706 TaxID=1212764 RepID=M9LBK0_PAEPP|nr:hypothetical protein [Paenibacillus popilliae]GAC43227.1 dehydrogenase [Paenibacillus popilliae ATCC 14706]
MIVALLDLKDDRTYQAGQQMNPFYPGRAIAYVVGLKDASRVENMIKEAAAHKPVRAVFAIAGINGVLSSIENKIAENWKIRFKPICLQHTQSGPAHLRQNDGARTGPLSDSHECDLTRGDRDPYRR